MASRTRMHGGWRAGRTVALAGLVVAAMAGSGPAAAGTDVKTAASVSKTRDVAAVTGRSVEIHVRGAHEPASRIIVVNLSGLAVTLHGWSAGERTLPSGTSAEFSCDGMAAGGIVEIDDGLYRHPRFVGTACGDVVTLRGQP